MHLPIHKHNCRIPHLFSLPIRSASTFARSLSRTSAMKLASFRSSRKAPAAERGECRATYHFLQDLWGGAKNKAIRLQPTSLLCKAVTRSSCVPCTLIEVLASRKSGTTVQWLVTTLNQSNIYSANLGCCLSFETRKNALKAFWKLGWHSRTHLSSPSAPCAWASSALHAHGQGRSHVPKQSHPQICEDVIQQTNS
jgi:hypothetical protein